GSALFVTAPVLLNRIGLHTALTSQWLLLWALYLYVTSRDARSRSWLVLLLLAVSIHAYLFLMVAALWLAHLAACRLRRTLSRRDLALAAGTLAVLVGWMHVLGYFSVGGGAGSGGGISRMDLTSFVAGGIFS